MKTSGNPIVEFVLAALTVVLFACSDGPMTGPVYDGRYPTTFASFSSDSLATLNKSFSVVNPTICTGLNEYGFTVGDYTAYACTYGRGVREDYQIAAFIAKTKVTLVQNSIFTGVKDTSCLSFTSSFARRDSWGNILTLNVNFKPQVYEGLVIQFMEIRLRMDSTGILSISGNHFPEIHIPNSSIHPDEAQRSLVGEVLTWYDFGGSPNEYVVTNVSFCRELSDEAPSIEPVKVILPHITERGIELRVAWRVEVGCDAFSHSGWWMYVDTVTGELLLSYQLFYSIAGRR